MFCKSIFFVLTLGVFVFCFAPASTHLSWAQQTYDIKELTPPVKAALDARRARSLRRGIVLQRDRAGPQSLMPRRI